MNPDAINGVALAFAGDAYYELRIRKYLLEKGYTKAKDLHSKGVKFTSGKSQSEIIRYLLDEFNLTDNEIDFYKKGRNAPNNQSRKSISLIEYKSATGFESLIGYLFLSGEIVRCDEIIDEAISFVERKLNNLN